MKHCWLLFVFCVLGMGTSYVVASEPPRSASALVASLRNAGSSWTDRLSTIDAMGSSSPPNSEFLAPLRTVIERDEIFAVRFMAAEALQKIDASIKCELVLDAGTDASKLGLKPIPPLPAKTVVRVPINPQSVRIDEKGKVIPIGADGQPISEWIEYNRFSVPTLAKMLDQAKTADEKEGLMHTIVEFGPNARDAVPALTRIVIQETDKDLLRSAIAFIGNIGPRAEQEETVKTLVVKLQHPDPEIRKYAAFSLSRLNAPVRIILRTSNTP